MRLFRSGFRRELSVSLRSLLLAVAAAVPVDAARTGIRSGVRPDAPPGEYEAFLLRDWLRQDAAADATNVFAAADGFAREQAVCLKALEECGPARAALKDEAAALAAAGVPGRDPRWTDLYVRCCERRRDARLAGRLPPRIVFARHYNLGGSHYAYTEGLSDAQAERHFEPGGALCLLEMDGAHGHVRNLVEAGREGVIRDVDVSYDGRRILFAWKKSDRGDDYHLYEYDVASGRVTALTSGLGFADYEGAYLPDGGIVFNSTRCVQTVDCWWTEVSNLYACDADGGRMRRLTFDQVHDNYPTVLEDGRVIYTRWEYNDRGQVYVQGLFQMNADGTAQTEFYGNNSWFPTTIIHARGIPGTQKVVATLTGHHSRQAGKLAVIDPRAGRQENSGVQLIAPIRETKAVRVDAYGQDGELFQYPYPLGETDFLVSYAPLGWADPVFGLYWMAADGRRELLAYDPAISSQRSVPLRARPVPHVRPSLVDYRKKTGVFSVQDVYAGPGLAGIERGAAKKLRVVSLLYRPAGIGSNGSGGEAGGALSSTPPAIGNGSWDPKVVLGEAIIHEDGSAMFEVPARTPVYFQVLDATNRVIQTMRSWSTLQPGEHYACVGCHEEKSAALLPAGRRTLAMQRGVETLTPMHAPPRGLSYARDVQPILDRHCVRCHSDRQAPPVPPGAASVRPEDGSTPRVFSLTGEPVVDTHAKRIWSDSYVALTQARGDRGALRGDPNGPWVRWVSVQSRPDMLPPYFTGSARSPLVDMLEKGHRGVRLGREELDRIACWIDLAVPYCADYDEAHAWNEKEMDLYRRFVQKRTLMEEMERKSIEDLIQPLQNAVSN